jgi:hypothetical protein
MTTTESHSAENKREYQGEAEAGVLLGWLNGTNDLEGKTRLRKLLDLAAAIHLNGNTYGAGWFNFRTSEHPDARERLRLEAEYNETLSYYELVPAYYLMGEGERMFYWRARPGSALDERQKELGCEEFTDGGELGAINAFLQLEWARNLDHVGECKCGKFYYRRFKHQRFCSSGCRLAEQHTSEEFKAKRRLLSKKYYRYHYGKTK